MTAATTQKSPLLPVEDARARILAALPLLDAEPVALGDALGRVAAEDVVARVNHPPQAVSAMDGYAMRAEDVRHVPARLRKLGVSRAGEQYGGTVSAGGCVRIFTGAVVPDGADTIALQEDSSEDGDSVVIREAPAAGKHIRAAGLDFRVGDRCVGKGRVLTARDVGLLAACGHGVISVRRRPRIAILSTGDELVEPGGDPAPDQIFASNGAALMAAVRAWGAEPIDIGIVADDIPAIAQAIDRAAGADLLLTTGGASVGDHDLVQAAAVERGLVLDFWRIAMRPGKPLMFGKVGAVPLIGLPGNPVSALVCALLFVKPAIAAMCGQRPDVEAFETAMLGVAMGANDMREDYVRAVVGFEGAQLVARPMPTQDSGMLAALTRSNGLIRRPRLAPAAAAGDLVDVIRFDASSARF